MAATVRFYDSNGYDAGRHLYGGRWTLSVDAFSAPAGTDGLLDEFDFVIADPDDPTVVWWGYIGWDTAQSPSLLTGGFTFDSDGGGSVTPDYFAIGPDSVSDYDAFTDAPRYQVPGATNFHRYNATWYDGDYALQGLGFVVGIDGASAADWWLGPAVPVPDPPTITAPAAAASFSIEDDLDLTVSWTPAGSEIEAQLTASGAVTYDSGTMGSVTSAVLVIPWGTNGTVTISVRTREDSGAAWSSWATEDITIASLTHGRSDCIVDDLIDAGARFVWLFRDSDPTLISDSGPDGVDGEWFADVAVEQTPAPICDPDCADASVYTLASSGAVGSAFEGAVLDPAVDSYSIELLAKPYVSAQVSQIVPGAGGGTGTITVAFGPSFIQSEVSVSGGHDFPVIDSETLDPDCWYHVVVTWDKNHPVDGQHIWINAALFNTGPAPPESFLPGNLSVTVLADPAGGGTAFALLAAYPGVVLSEAWIANHFAHLCNLCIEGGGWIVGSVSMGSL